MPAPKSNARPAPTTQSVSAAALGLEFDLGSFFLDEDEKNDAIDTATPFYITSIDYDPENQYGPRYVLTVEASEAETPTPRGWSMAASNAKRNQIIDQIATVMSQQDIARVGPVVFERRGRTVMFRPIEQPSAEATSEAEDLPF